jgi:hypothetical protein
MRNFWARQGSFVVELVIASIVIASSLLVQLYLLDGLRLIFRPLWLDEFLTYHIVSDSNFIRAVAAIADGVDFNPPTYHFLLRQFLGVFFLPISIEASFRVFSLLCLWSALLGMYLLVRKNEGPLNSAISALALWSYPMVQCEAFSARFYIPLLAASVWFILSLRLLSSSTNTNRYSSHIFVALTASLLCTIHYFGILVFSLVLLGSCRTVKLSCLSLLALACGPIALAACLPLLEGQAAALRIPSWIPPLNFQRLLWALGWYYPLPIFLVIFLTFLCRHRIIVPQRSGTNSKRHSYSNAVIPLGLPLLLLIISLALRPVYQPRYGISVAIGTASLLALALALISPSESVLKDGSVVSCPLQKDSYWKSILISRTARIKLMICCSLVAISSLGVYKIAKEEKDRGKWLDTLDKELSATPATDRIVFDYPSALLPLSRINPELARRLYLLDFSNIPTQSMDPLKVVALDFSKKLNKWYDLPQMMTIEQACSYDNLLFVPHYPHVSTTNLRAIGLDCFAAESKAIGVFFLSRKYHQKSEDTAKKDEVRSP